MQKWNMRCIAVQSAQGTHATYGIVQRTESDWTADGIRLGSERNLIGQRTETSGDVPPTDAPTKQTERVFPQNTQNTQNILAEKCLPQIGTDTHRLGGYGIPAIPTPPITQPNILWIPWENTTTLINKQTGRECPTEYTEHTENSGREVPPTDCTDVHRLGATNAT